MKRIIAFILCLVMAFSLCACKGDEPAPSAQPTAEPERAEYLRAVGTCRHDLLRK